MSSIFFHGSRESLAHIADRIKNHRLRRDAPLKHKGLAPRALIVDDEVESIQPLQIVLRNFGFEITLAFDGRSAFEEISKQDFDIVFLDICMPEMSGLEVLEQVESFQNHDRQFSKRGYPLPVVTYSSYNMEDYGISDGERFFFAGHWQKPLNLGDLVTLTGETIDALGLFKKNCG